MCIYMGPDPVPMMIHGNRSDLFPTYNIEVGHSLILPHNPLLSDYLLLSFIINDDAAVDKDYICLQ